MTTRKPDGYCAWHPERGFNVLMPYEERFNGIPLTGGGYVRPYYAISPSDYDAAIREAEERAWDRAKENLFVVRTETENLGNASTVQTSSPETYRDWRKSRGEK